jgi:DNA-binding MarR family transcriptional regulator
MQFCTSSRKSSLELLQFATLAQTGVNQAGSSPQHISSLIARGLVVRRTNPRDNREVLISLTRAGKNSYAKIMEAGLAANDVLLAELSPIKQKKLVDQIERLTIRARALLRIEHDLSAMSADKS